MPEQYTWVDRQVGKRGLWQRMRLAELPYPPLVDDKVTMQRFASDEEAIAMANGVRYGLAASVFSENVGRALSAAKRLDFGTVWINEHLFPLASEMPHGGFKQSGYGKDMSLYSMEEYTRIKHVAVKLS